MLAIILEGVECYWAWQVCSDVVTRVIKLLLCGWLRESVPWLRSANAVNFIANSTCCLHLHCTTAAASTICCCYGCCLLLLLPTLWCCTESVHLLMCCCWCLMSLPWRATTLLPLNPTAPAVALQVVLGSCICCSGGSLSCCLSQQVSWLHIMRAQNM